MVLEARGRGPESDRLHKNLQTSRNSALCPVHLGTNFEVGPGPKFHVYLVPKKPVTSAADVKTSMFIDLCRLRPFKGSQNYPVSAGLDLSNYGSVMIWCKAFGVLISPAALDPVCGLEHLIFIVINGPGERAS